MSAGPVSVVKATVVLRGLPRTALVADIGRLLRKYKVENVQHIHLDFRRFLPTGKAYVTFSNPAFVRPAFLLLRTAEMSGLPLDVTTTGPLQDMLLRMRGAKGREAAIKRGIVTGNGPDAGVRERGKNVVLWGLPGKLQVDELQEFLKDFKLSGKDNGTTDVVKLPQPEERPSFTSKYYVRTVSISEAHRMVRRLHMTRWNKGSSIIRAQVVY